jgi:hypothetical protein
MSLPPDVLDLARLHRLRQQQLARMAVGEVRTRWATISASNVTAGWSAIAPTIEALVTAAQAEATRGVQEYVAAAVRMQGADPAPAGQVLGRSLAGVASDGRDLSGLLGYPAFQVDAFVDGGMPTAQALGIGLRHLDRIVLTQIQDAARVGTGVAIVNDRRAAGYIRVTTPPSCSRCAILAGVWYSHSAGFRRHPQCDCTSAPATDEVEPQSPKALFDAMSPSELRKAGWTDADVKAINEGADLGQVTNTHRGLRSMSVAGQRLQVTGQGATRRGFAGQRLGARKGASAIRLTPESIYSEAERLGWSRDETIRALKANGYII